MDIAELNPHDVRTGTRRMFMTLEILVGMILGRKLCLNTMPCTVCPYFPVPDQDQSWRRLGELFLGLLLDRHLLA